MYRSLSMDPKSADQVAVDEHVKQVAAAFAKSPGFVSCTTSVDTGMGPCARVSDVGRVVIVDFESLDDALNALGSESFREIGVVGESLTSMHDLFECREV
jgi:hypothetical protein